MALFWKERCFPAVAWWSYNHRAIFKKYGQCDFLIQLVSDFSTPDGPSLTTISPRRFWIMGHKCFHRRFVRSRGCWSSWHRPCIHTPCLQNFPGNRRNSRTGRICTRCTCRAHVQSRFGRWKLSGVMKNLYDQYEKCTFNQGKIRSCCRLSNVKGWIQNSCETDFQRGWATVPNTTTKRPQSYHHLTSVWPTFLAPLLSLTWSKFISTRWLNFQRRDYKGIWTIAFKSKGQRKGLCSSQNLLYDFFLLCRQWTAVLVPTLMLYNGIV